MSATSPQHTHLPRERSDVVVLGIIAVLGIAAAAVCFGLLQSEAEATVGYSISGAIVGLLLSWSALGSLYLNLRRDTREFGDLQRENRELAQKLLRSAPRPMGFELEVDEHQRIVLARPQEWERGGGTIFDYQLTASHMDAGDVFPARFALHFEPLAEELTPEEFYAHAKGAYDEYMTRLGASYTSEVVHVGGTEGIPSLKFSAQAYARVSMSSQEKPGTSHGGWAYVERAEFRKRVGWLVEKAIADRLAHAPKDLDTAEGIARAKGVLVPHVERALEKWEVDPTRGVRDLIEALLDDHGEELLGDAARRDPDEAHRASADATVATSAAAQGVEGLHAESQARSENNQGTARDDGDEAILPVGRMIVVCCHPGVRKVYTFDFVDNASDYARASETFNKIMTSVRFLV